MIKEYLVNETVDALVRVTPNGEVRPTSFLWRDKTRYVSDIGRQWEERVAGKTLRCYLLQTVEGNSYELRWDAGSNVWTVHRAWLRAMMV
jgi:hypothetical protein